MSNLIATCVPINDLDEFLFFVLYHTSITWENGERPYVDDLKDIKHSDLQYVYFYLNGGYESKLAYATTKVKILNINRIKFAKIENRVFRLVTADEFWERFCNNALMLQRKNDE